jgi:hypothetical protein
MVVASLLALSWPTSAEALKCQLFSFEERMARPDVVVAEVVAAKVTVKSPGKGIAAVGDRFKITKVLNGSRFRKGEVFFVHHNLKWYTPQYKKGDVVLMAAHPKGTLAGMCNVAIPLYRSTRSQ